MKRFVIVTTLILVSALLLGMIPASGTERPFASNGNGIATFITDGAGNVTGATVTLSGNGTHLGLFTGTGTIQFLPDANDPNISHPAGKVTYTASNGSLTVCVKSLPTMAKQHRKA